MHYYKINGLNTFYISQVEWFAMWWDRRIGSTKSCSMISFHPHTHTHTHKIRVKYVLTWSNNSNIAQNSFKTYTMFRSETWTEFEWKVAKMNAGHILCVVRSSHTHRMSEWIFWLWFKRQPFSQPLFDSQCKQRKMKKEACWL